MKNPIKLSAGLLLFAGYVVSDQSLTLSTSGSRGQTYRVRAGSGECNLSAFDLSSSKTQYKSLVSCSASSSAMPSYYTFDYDTHSQSFTKVHDSLGNQGTCKLASSSPSRVFDCKIPSTGTLASSSANTCDADRQKCIKVCEKGSASPACYRNCTSLYNDCKKKAPTKDCDADRQKCIKVCEKGSASPACYRNCTALYNECKKPSASVKKLATVMTSTSQCDTERQKCIKVCDKGSRSPACYRNCTSLYNDCKKKAPTKDCDADRQKCIKVCDKGSRSPACYRNCTSLYNDCKEKASTKDCDADRQKCIKVCEKGSRSPACYRNCTSLYNDCKKKAPAKDCDADRQKCIKVCEKGSASPACYRNCTALYNECKKPSASVKKLATVMTSTSQCDTERQKCIKVCDKGSRSPACYRNCTSLYNDCKKKAPTKNCDADRQKCIKVCDKGSRSPACYRNCTALYNQCENKKGHQKNFTAI